MSKIDVNWDANLHPNKHDLPADSNQKFAVVHQRITYGSYPIQDTVRDTIMRIA